MGQYLLQCLWDKANDNIEVARVFCPDSNGSDRTHYARAISSLFSFRSYDTDNIDGILFRIREIREMLLHARDSESTTANQQIMIQHFSNLLDNLQLQYEPLSLSAALSQAASSLRQSNQAPDITALFDSQQPSSNVVQVAYPTRVRNGQPMSPQWLMQQHTEE